jgi:HSP20 family protein
MNLIKNNTSLFPSILDSFFGINDLDIINANNFVPAVNIKEREASYELYMAIPGKTKKDFMIEFENDILSISDGMAKKNELNNKDYFPLHEFSYNQFKRSFKIPKIVEIDRISAKYLNGVLQIFLPKLKEAISSSKKTYRFT